MFEVSTSEKVEAYLNHFPSEFFTILHIWLS
jgi:hypothetical protein